jgi:homocitrate synthase
LSRHIAIGHRLTGWNAVRNRAVALGLTLDDDTLRHVTQQIKSRADENPMGLHEVDALLMEMAVAS